MDSNMEPIRNQEIDADQFNNLQINAPTIMEDRGNVDGTRVMILHLEPVVGQDDHADLDADFSHELDSNYDLDWRFEACGRCMELGIDHMFKKMVADVQLPEDLKGGDDK
jgi:hypothetical protein